MGDDVQALKAGVMEIADVFVVNKADREAPIARSQKSNRCSAFIHTGKASGVRR